MEKIITYSLQDDFIIRVADFLEENFIKKGADTSKLAFVFGGRRPALFMKKELAGRAKKAFFPPQFFSIDELVDHIVSEKDPFTRISELDACFIIYNLAKDIAPDILKERASFSQFLPWAREILSFIEQMDLEDIKISSLENIQQNAAIGYEVPESINVILSKVILLRSAFHSVLKEKKAYSRGLTYLLASDYVNQADLSGIEQFFFCNFFYMHKTERDIAKHLFEKNKLTMFFQGDEKDWPVLKELSKVFSFPISSGNAQKPDYNLNIYSAFDIHSQACQVREILKKIKNPEKTVIVLPEPENIMPLLSEISSCVSDFNISMGYPLRRSSVYSLFENIFNAQNTRKDGQYYTKDYLSALNHPLVKNLKLFSESSVTRIFIHKIQELLLGEIENSLAGRVFIKTSDIEGSEELYSFVSDTLSAANKSFAKEELKNIVKELHDILFLRWENLNNFYEFSKQLEAVTVEFVNKSPLEKDPFSPKMIDRIFSIQKELELSSFSKEAFTKEDIFKIFKNKLDSEAISFLGSPLKGLQILGFFETRSLNFENVIIMDVNETVLPKLKIYEPLIPREVMLMLGLNRLEKEDQIQRYQFMRLVSSAKNVYLLYQHGQVKEKSRFIEELIWEKQKEAKSLDAVAIQQVSFKIMCLPKKIQVENKSSDMIAFLKSHMYSASSVNTYINCPLRFYYQYALGLKEKEWLTDEPEAADIGTFVHELLEETFGKFIAKKPLIDSKFRKYFFAVMDRRFSRTIEKKMKSDSFLTKEVLDFRMKRFLENEKERKVREVVCVEKVITDKILLGKEFFNFTARVDRIDRLTDNSLLVLDYKTGSHDSVPKNICRLKETGFSRQAIKKIMGSFQLPLYLYFAQNTYKDSKINAALYSLRELNKDFGLKKFLNSEEDFARKDEIMEVFTQALGFVIQEILDPKVPFVADDEDPYKCKNCPFFYLCR